ncbi:CU044_5270 family protein [Streptomyces sp. NPDC020845]|uniref:CU044_5270 family protein n=1 Tax=Streptomyces sp. NPDC020845 TaxID=3365096 RepID=UPI0037B5DAD8
MTDELDLLRGADPVPADAERWRDRPLDFDGERRLRQLVSGARRRRTVRRVVMGVATATAGAVVAIALTVSGPASSPAVAAPVALRPHASAADVSLAEIAGRARAAAAAEPGKSVRGSHVQDWSMGLESGKDAVTVPQETLTRWNADGSGSLLVVATDPRHPGRPVIDDGYPPRTVHDGKVVRRESYPPGMDGANQSYFEPPPAGAAALRDYLAVWHPGADRDPDELLGAVQDFLRVWTPGPREIANLATLLSRDAGLRPAGRVTDRMGREGQAFVRTTAGLQQMVILDPDDGRVLDMEETCTRDDPEYRLKAGDVFSYTAWLS